MKSQLYFYEVTPKVVLAGEKTKITLKAKDRHVYFDKTAQYTVMIVPLEDDSYSFTESGFPVYDVKPENNTIEFEHCFIGEQNNIIRLFKNYHNSESRKVVEQFYIYSLYEDLYSKNFYKGDFHVHSFHSDGTESPEFLAALYRRYGFDFYAMTDHGQFKPSQEAINAYKGTDIDLKIFTGEEIHLKNNHIHNINFGGKYSINELCRNDEEKYEQEVNDLINTLDIPEGVNAFEYASCVWTYEKTRESGGLAIFCHPYWISNGYNVSENFLEFLMKEKPFDAYEILGGNPQMENNLQVSIYHKMSGQQKNIGIVGSSDVHKAVNGELFNEMYTIVFSESNEFDDIKDAVIDCYSVAVEEYHNEHYRVHGPHRLVKYTTFLMSDFFPIHHELCMEEGLQMIRYIYGYEDAKNVITQLKGRTDEFRNIFFGRK